MDIAYEFNWKQEYYSGQREPFYRNLDDLINKWLEDNPGHYIKQVIPLTYPDNFKGYQSYFSYEGKALVIFGKEKDAPNP